MTKRKKLIWIPGGLVLLVAAAFIILPALTSGSAGQVVTQTALVERGSITETVDSLGVVSSEPTALLTWESGGIISTFNLKVGDQVEKGDVLLGLEDSSKSADILQAQTSLLEAQVELDKLLVADTNYLDILKEVTYQELILTHKYNARHVWYSSEVFDERVEAVRANYDKARRKVWELEAAYEKVRKLEKEDPQRVDAYKTLQAAILGRDSLLRALSQILGTPFNYLAETDFNEYDQQVALVSETRAAYERYMDSSDEISAVRAKVQALQNTIDQASIIAPFTGTITAINAVAGEQVSSGDMALQLDDLSNLTIDLEISQMDINKIHHGQPAQLTFDAIPDKTYSGTVMEIAEAGTDCDGVIEFSVRVSLDDADELVKPGLTVTVSIITNQVKDVLLIPNTAIQYDADGAAYVMEAGDLGGFTALPIETGARSDAFTELKSGDLTEGDRLAVVQVKDTTLEFGPFRRTRNP
ncbi:MAG: efflux RND transporter periplasmic adaptor subunit [Anaerolineaceae bacterium]|nr:efflux RND transporter periplasmic adaptor subunit [Anaerolineaceae bacterium]